MNPGTEPTRPARSAATSSTDSRYPHLFCIESRRETLWLMAGSLAFALIFFFPVLYNSHYIGSDFGQWLNRWPDLSNFSAPPSDADRDLFEQLRWVPYYTLSHFHQVPFWNPYRCGGMAMLGNPESGIVTPFIALYLLFGLMPGMILEIYLHLVLAFAGGYVLGRELGLRPLPSVVLAAIFPSSSWLPLHIGGGAHLNFLPAAYFAWILALLLSACRTRRWFPAALGGLVCALTLTEGNYTFLYAALLVAMVAVAISLRRLQHQAVVGGWYARRFCGRVRITEAHSSLGLAGDSSKRFRRILDLGIGRFQIDLFPQPGCVPTFDRAGPVH